MSRKKGTPGQFRFPKSKVSSDFWNNEFMNTRTFQLLFQQIAELAINAIEYENLPDTVDPRWIETQLFYQGFCVYFRDPIIGDLALEAALGGRLDLYNIPVERRAFSANGYQAKLTKQDSVIIYNNYLHTPGIAQAELFAYRLANVQRTIDVNVNAQKMPFIIKTSNEQKLTAKNLMKNIQGNELYVYVDEDYDMKGLEVTPTPAPYISDKLRTLYRDIWNECLTFYGYENSNQNKKERSVEAEVTAEYGWIEGQRNIMLKSRRECFDKVNKMFGTDIKVKFSSELPSLINMPDRFLAEGTEPEEIETEVVENE